MHPISGPGPGPAILEEAAVAFEAIKNVHKSAPKGKPKSRGQYADPKNYKWPVDAKHIRAAVSYFNHGNRSGYSPAQWATIGRRIASAASRLIRGGYAFAKGKIKPPSKKKKGGMASEAYQLFECRLALDEVGALAVEDLFAFLLSDEAAFLDGDAPAPSASASEEALALLPDYMPVVVTVLNEETAVNGVPAFRYEAMAIPADAVSRNTVPGKKGPTYYSARRMRQYHADNTALLAQMEARGEHVTVYPRHLAAQLEATLPLGWVEQYFTRPSSRLAGAEDLWYRAVVPLTSAGHDARLQMRSGLVKYSSLRTFPSPSFKTEPVKVNGQVVEEAVALPIAGIDLVATAPGLPVAPIRLLEEVARPEPLSSGSSAVESLSPFAGGVYVPPAFGGGGSPYSSGGSGSGTVSTPSQFTITTSSSTTIPPSPQSSGRHEAHAMGKSSKYACPACQADIDAIVAHALAAEERKSKKLGTALEDESRARKKAEKKLKELETAAAAAASNGTEEQQQNGQPAADKLAAQAAEIAALKTQLTALEEVKAHVEAQRQRETVFAAAQKLIDEDEDPAYAAFIAPVVEEALSSTEHPVTDPAAVPAIYWRIRAEAAPQYYQARGVTSAGFGVVHLKTGGNAAGTEEAATRSAAGQVGTPVVAAEDQGAGRGAGGASRPSRPMNATKAEALRMMGRVTR